MAKKTEVANSKETVLATIVYSQVYTTHQQGYTSLILECKQSTPQLPHQ